ncbi:ABC transporter permease [bacterium]|nr:ABC transporter permease [bacterium]
MKSVIDVCVREWRRVFTDPGALMLLVVAAGLYGVFYPQPYLPEVLVEVPTVVVDHDGTPLSRRLVRMADASQLVQVSARTTNRLEAADLVRRGEAGAMLEIPRGFERDVLRGQPATVACFTDAAYFLVYRQAATGLRAAAGTLSAGIEIQRLEAAGMTADQAADARAPVVIADRPLFNPAEGYASYIVPGVMVLILQQTLLIGIGLLAGTAREDGERPASAGSLATTAGRVLAYLAIYFVHAFFYFVVVFRLFNLPYRGQLGTTFAFALPFLLAAICLAFILANLFRQRETALQVLLFTSLPAVFLSGFAWPTEMLPRWLGTVALLLPSTAGTEGFLRVNQMGATLSQVTTEWRLLWVLAGAYFLLAWWIHAVKATAASTITSGIIPAPMRTDPEAPAPGPAST